MPCVPAVDLALTGREEVFQTPGEGAVDQRVHRLQAVAVCGHRERMAVAPGSLQHPAAVVFRQEGAVAGQGEQPLGLHAAQPGQHAGQGTLKIFQGIADHRAAQFPVFLDVAVGIDQDPVRLGGDLVDKMLREGAPAQGQQSLVETAHAGGTAPGQDDCGDFPVGFRHDRRVAARPGSVPVRFGCLFSRYCASPRRSR